MAKKGKKKSFKGAKFNFNITDNSDAVLEATDEQIEKALIECGIKIQEYASKNAPVDTGRLRASLTYATSKGQGSGDSTPRGEAEEHTLYAGTNVEYAPYVEMGHTTPTGKHVSAQPYLEPAFVNQFDLFQQIFEDNFKKLDGN